MIRQEITIDSTYLRHLSLMLGNEYFTNTDLREEYHKIVINLREYHNLCVDKSEEGSESIWISRLKNLLQELNNYEKYGCGQVLHELLRNDFINFFLEDQNQKISIVHLSNISIDSIDLDIAKNTDFKILLNDKVKKYEDIIVIPPDEFYTKYNSPYSLLLRNPRTIDFEKDDDMMELKFLWPYLYYSEKIEVQDKFIFEEQNHIELLLKLFSYIKDPKKIIIKTLYEKQNQIDSNLYKELQNSLQGVEIIMKNFPKAHPRRIVTDYAKIEITNTLKSINFSNNKWIASQAISFNCSLLKN